MANGEWRMPNAKCQMPNAKCQMPNAVNGELGSTAMIVDGEWRSAVRIAAVPVS
jgi:hypothetical protein